MTSYTYLYSMYKWTKALHSNNLALFTERLLTTALLHYESLFRLYLPFTATFTVYKDLSLASQFVSRPENWPSE
jgi:hypothetical protein